MELIRLSRIKKEFENPLKQKQIVLSNVNVSFQDKGFYVIEGQSGTGKSTLIKIIAQIIEPSSGKYYYQNSILPTDAQQRSHFRNQQVGLLFQDYQLIDNLNALENVILPCLIKGESVKEAYGKAYKLFQTINLESKMKAFINELSGGEKQRVSFLRCLINEPTFYLCDEPTGALDEENAHLLLKELKIISQTKLVIVVTHNPIVAREYADYVYLLKDGELYEK